MTTLGFISIKNVEGFNEAETYENAKQFHSISEEDKDVLKWKNHNKNNTNIYRGLAPFVDNDESHKELFDMGIPLRLVSEEEKKYALYEETPFPPNKPEL